MPKISIVIPTKNEEKFIGKTLDHLYKQSFNDFEIIISDGNSKDNTEKVINKLIPKFEKRGIKISFITTLKKGVSIGRNLGAEIAKGKYIYFLDADVYPGRNFIKNTINEFKKRRLSIATVKSRSSDNLLKNKTFHALSNNNINFLQFTPVPAAYGHCIICSKNAFNKIGGFDPDIYLAEDVTFVIRGRKLKLRFRVLNSEKIVVSTRRLNSEGTLNVTIKYILCALYWISKGEGPKHGTAEKLLKYKMGHGYLNLKDKKYKIILKRIKKMVDQNKTFYLRKLNK